MRYSDSFSSTLDSVDDREIIRLSSVNNFRDVAGYGYPIASGGHMRRGVLFRSNVLTLSDEDISKVLPLRIGQIYDLRTEGEVSDQPDVLPPGALYTRVNIFADDSVLVNSSVFDVVSPLEAKEYLAMINRSFVSQVNERYAFGRLLTLIANFYTAHQLNVESSNLYQTSCISQLFHCTSGKDRTGWAAAIIQLLVGVELTAVMEDYLLSNECTRDSIMQTTEKVLCLRDKNSAETIRELLSVNPEALTAGLEEMYTTFGTVERYVNEGLGVDVPTIEVLRQALIVV